MLCWLTESTNLCPSSLIRYIGYTFLFFEQIQKDARSDTEEEIESHSADEASGKLGKVTHGNGDLGIREDFSQPTLNGLTTAIHSTKLTSH